MTSFKISITKTLEYRRHRRVPQKALYSMSHRIRINFVNIEDIIPLRAIYYGPAILRISIILLYRDL